VRRVGRIALLFDFGLIFFLLLLFLLVFVLSLPLSDRGLGLIFTSFSRFSSIINQRQLSNLRRRSRLLRLLNNKGFCFKSSFDGERTKVSCFGLFSSLLVLLLFLLLLLSRALSGVGGRAVRVVEGIERMIHITCMDEVEGVLVSLHRDQMVQHVLYRRLDG